MTTASDQSVYAIAKQRCDSIRHLGHYGHHDATQHQGDPMHNYLLGVSGEKTAAILLGCLVNENVDARGDGGIDFRFVDGTLDAKCAMKAGHLPVLESEVDRCADYFMMCEAIKPFEDPYLSRFVGWATRDEVLGYPPRLLWYGSRSKSHNIPVANLNRDVSQLIKALGEWIGYK